MKGSIRTNRNGIPVTLLKREVSHRPPVAFYPRWYSFVGGPVGSPTRPHCFVSSAQRTQGLDHRVLQQPSTGWQISSERWNSTFFFDRSHRSAQQDRVDSLNR